MREDDLNKKACASHLPLIHFTNWLEFPAIEVCTAAPLHPLYAASNSFCQTLEDPKTQNLEVWLYA